MSSTPLSRGRDDSAPGPLSPPLSRLDTSSPRPKPRPKLVSFARDSPLGGRPDTDGDADIEFIHHADHPPRMSSEVDPLLKEAMSPNSEDDSWLGESQVEETKSSWFLFLLTFGGLGLQIGWSVETSNGSVSAFSACLFEKTSLARYGPCVRIGVLLRVFPRWRVCG